MNGIVSCITGRVGGDPEFKYSQAGHPFLTFSLAADDSKRADGDPTEWVRVVVFGERAEDLNGKLVKGARCYAEGRIRLDQWTGRDGEQRASLKLTAWIVQPMGHEGRRPGRGPSNEPARLGEGGPGRQMPEAVAVGAGRRDTRQALDLDDLDDVPF
jgi:single-strand DNA-binding protein